MPDKNSLEPGIYGASERWLSDTQIEAMATHITTIPKIWLSLRHINDNDRIEGELEIQLIDELREYVARARLVASGEDLIAIVDCLRNKAKHFQSSQLQGKS